MSDYEPESKPETKISGDDIESVSRKLEDLVKGLPEQEQNVLGLILTRAAAAGEVDFDAIIEAEPRAEAEADAEAVRAFDKPFAGQLARAAGISAKPEVTVIVGWSYRFGFEGLPEIENPV
jgi:hypothetical protein